MGIFIGLLYFVEVVVCILLALIVMLQKPKEGGLGGAFGGGALEGALGADAGNVLIKATAVLGAVFLLNTLVLARLTSTKTTSSVVGDVEAAPVAAPAAALPQLPELPAALPEEAPVQAPAAAPAAKSEAPAAPTAAPAAKSEAPAAPAAAPAAAKPEAPAEAK